MKTIYQDFVINLDHYEEYEHYKVFIGQANQEHEDLLLLLMYFESRRDGMWGSFKPVQSGYEGPYMAQI